MNILSLCFIPLKKQKDRMLPLLLLFRLSDVGHLNDRFAIGYYSTKTTTPKKWMGFT